MKLQFKALSVTLGLVALLGACTSVKSGTPDITDAENSVELPANDAELGGVEEMETEDAGLEASDEFGTDELEASEEMDTEELEASDEFGTDELEASEEMETEELGADEEIEDAELEASEEIEDAESAEIETPELEAVEDAESIDESSSIDGTVNDGVETVEEDTDDVNSQF